MVQLGYKGRVNLVLDTVDLIGLTVVWLTGSLTFIGLTEYNCPRKIDEILMHFSNSQLESDPVPSLVALNLDLLTFHKKE
eukprot:2926365-Amphidinium_carterae.1